MKPLEPPRAPRSWIRLILQGTAAGFATVILVTVAASLLLTGHAWNPLIASGQWTAIWLPLAIFYAVSGRVIDKRRGHGR